jgi:hypothetical protein
MNEFQRQKLHQAAQRDEERAIRSITDELIPRIGLDPSAQLPDGVTPLETYQAIAAISAMLGRIQRRRKISGREIRFDAEGALQLQAQESIAADVVIKEVRLATGLSEEKTRGLLGWLRSAVSSKHDLFEGFQYADEGWPDPKLREMESQQDPREMLETEESMASVTSTLTGTLTLTVDSSFVDPRTKDGSFELTFMDNVVTLNPLNLEINGLTIQSDPTFQPQSGTFVKATGDLDLPCRFNVTGTAPLVGDVNFTLTFAPPGLTTEAGTPQGPYNPQGDRLDAAGTIRLAGATIIQGHPLDGQALEIVIDGTLSPIP